MCFKVSLFFLHAVHSGRNCQLCFRSNSFNRTLSMECFQLNAFNQTLLIERFQLNAFDRTLAIERFIFFFGCPHNWQFLPLWVVAKKREVKVRQRSLNAVSCNCIIHQSGSGNKRRIVCNHTNSSTPTAQWNVCPQK